jgi:carboxylate-amine ligase
VDASFASSVGAIPLTEMLEDTLARVAPDAEALGCSDDVNHCRKIVIDGSSADAQLRVFTNGMSKDGGALNPVLRWIADATIL